MAGVQSVLAPGGVNASEIATLWWWMFGVGMAILALVVALYAYVLYTRPDQRPNVSTNAIVIAGGVVLPIVCFSILLPMSFAVARLWTADVPPGTLRVEVQGNQWWWRVQYLEPGRGDLSFFTSNEIHVPTGRPAEIFLTSNDVIHSLWVPGMGGKTQLIPGIRNRMVIQADKPGRYRAQCAEFCGLAACRIQPAG